jgi:copper transport protein
VTWRVVSVDDGHVTAGAFAFGVGTPPGAPAATTTTSSSGPTPLAIASKAVLYAGLMLLVAIAAIALGLFHGAPAARRRLGVIAGAVAFLGALGFLVSQQRAIGVPLDTYLRSSAARPTIWLLVATAVAAAFALVATRAVRWAPWAAGAAAAVALALRAHGGHAAAGQMPVLEETIQWVHMLAGACWAGGLLLLVLLLRERTTDPPIAEAHRYSNMALGAVAVVVASGLIRSVAELGGWSGLANTLDSSYGQILAIKATVVALVIGLGAYNRRRSVRRLHTDARPLRRIAVAELLAIGGVLLLTATLTSLAPPGGEAAAATGAPTNAVVLTGSDFATTIDATVTVTPAQPGPNLFRVTVVAYGTEDAVAADAVTLRLQSVTRPTLPAATIRLRPDTDGGSHRPSTRRSMARTACPSRCAPARPSARFPHLDHAVGRDHHDRPAPGGDTVAVATFGDGVRLQADSSAASPTQIHVTAFAADGSEFALRDLALVASPATGSPQRLATERFTAGTSRPRRRLPPARGRWTPVATARDGRTYQCTWQTVVAGRPAQPHTSTRIGYGFTAEPITV